MAVQKIRIKLAAYDHELVDEAASPHRGNDEKERREDLGAYSPSYGKRDRHDPAFPAQIQGFPRAVRNEDV